MNFEIVSSKIVLSNNLRKIKIRYCWLISQMKRRFKENFEEGYIFFKHLIEIAKLIKMDEKIYSYYDNSGNQCISLKNISIILYKQLNNYYMERISYLKRCNKYLEVIKLKK